MILKPENLEKLKSCGVSFLDAPEEVFATVLNYLGKDPNSTKADDYTGPATDLLLKLRPNIRYFHSSQYINDLANGDTCVAIGWAGRCLAGGKPREGSEEWRQCLLLDSKGRGDGLL